MSGVLMIYACVCALGLLVYLFERGYSKLAKRTYPKEQNNDVHPSDDAPPPERKNDPNYDAQSYEANRGEKGSILVPLEVEEV
jgi:hypothetical protein